ncbi:hypothetical protein ACIQVE_27505 [Pseudomonas sp. NPDC098747]|uniref:hypothetical protein n=1 Tax=Pseudomonas sp. NPDC098747 TaxID=3364487 RepID=UPI00383B9773
MRAEDFQVQRELIKAGYSGSAVECRGTLHETLGQMLRDDPESADFVDRLRTLLSIANRLDEQAELDQARTEHCGVKACPECGHRPDIGYLVNSGEEIYVSCMNHGGEAIACGATTLSEAIAKWNRDDWLPPQGERVLFEL